MTNKALSAVLTAARAAGMHVPTLPLQRELQFSFPSASFHPFGVGATVGVRDSEGVIDSEGVRDSEGIKDGIGDGC